MDLLARRYANPFFLLEEMISQRRFKEFVCEVNTLENEERLREFWLLRVHDKSFDAFKNSLTVKVEQSRTYDATETVKNSFDILKGFNPEMGR